MSFQVITSTHLETCSSLARPDRSEGCHVQYPKSWLHFKGQPGQGHANILYAIHADAGLLCPIHILSSLKVLRQSPSPGRSSPKHQNLLFQQKQVQGMDKGVGTLLRCPPSS